MMEINMNFSAIALAILFMFTVSLSLLSALTRGKRKDGRFGMPGPKGLPIIGNLHQLGDLPHRSLHRLAEKHGPIMAVKFGSIPIVVASSSLAAKQFLKTHDSVFANRPSIGAAKFLFYNHKDIVFGFQGDFWRNMRKMCTVEMLNAQRVESFNGVREAETLAMVKSIWEKSEHGEKAVDVSRAVASYISDLMWRILTSRTHSDSASRGTEFEDLVWEGNVLVGAVNIGDFFPWLEWLDLQGLRRRMNNIHYRLDAVYDKIIDEHVEHRAKETEGERNKDLIDVLLDMELSHNDRKAIINDMFFGAIESSATTLEWIMSELMRNPYAMKKLQEEVDFVVGKNEKVTIPSISRMEYLHCVLKETLRLYPIGPLLIPHESTEPCTIEGPDCEYSIPAKTRMIVNAWAIGRDPAVWENPLEFKPERFLDKIFDMVRDQELRMIPFGAGRRGCPGASMAIANIEIALAHLVHCFNWKCDKEIDMDEKFGSTIPRKVHLFAVPTWRLHMKASDLLNT